jgi:hypothetical protein
MSKISRFQTLSTYPQDFIISLLAFLMVYKKNKNIRKKLSGKGTP